ncbi:cobyric acid synthase [Oceanobacillus sp. CAU 1775]
MRGIMIQGTASDVGKSLVLTALCRMLIQDGYRVAPFKSQNMSNHTYKTRDGKEISKAQALQAEAADVEATVWMNPIVLKPNTDLNAEVILLGESQNYHSGKMYREKFYEIGLEAITKSLKILEAQYDVVVMEGAGSPVEINLKDKELVNMKVAELADVPVLLVADIDRGGVFASIIGTLTLLSESEKRRVKGIIINKFRGDLSLFKDGATWIEKKTGIPVVGIIPFLHHNLEPEDSLSKQNLQASQGKINDYDQIAKEVRAHLDLNRIINIMEQWDNNESIS